MRTIRRQLTWKLLLAFALPLALGGAGVFFSTRATLLEQFDATLRAMALAITTAARQNGQRIEAGITDPLTHESDERKPTSFFQIARVDGAILERSASLGTSSLPLRFSTSNWPKFWNLTLPTGSAGRAFGLKFVPQIDDDDGEHPVSAPAEAVLVVAVDRDELD